LSIRVGGVSVDLDESFGTDFGQYPRPVKNGPAPDKPEKLSANGLLSLRRAVNAHGTTLVRSLELTLANQSGKFTPQQATYIRTSSSFPDGNMPRGMPYWVGK
jgi:hypothetical protein